MGCSSGGCGCSSANGIGCNKLNVFDWLSDIPDNPSMQHKYVEVSFGDGGRKEFYANPTGFKYTVGQWVSVEGQIVGIEVGKVCLAGYLVLAQMKKMKINPNDKNKEIKSVLRIATEDEIKQHNVAKRKEQTVLIRARVIVKDMNIEMKLSQVEIQSDEKRVTFYYIASDRVDFRELIKRYASEFKMKIEMKQISDRKEAGMIGGIGSCGRELCCSSWLVNPKSVNIAAARYQDLSIKSEKLNGQCGRLKCCLNYELDAYIEALNDFPQHPKKLTLRDGSMKLVKKNIFKRTMVYEIGEDQELIVLSIEDVKNILDKKIATIEAVKKLDKTPNKEKNTTTGVKETLSI